MTFVISLNGLPIATLELKNHFTGQTVDNAKKQYATTRDNKELLFAFKKRALVHFAVDPDEVYMATKIDAERTYWLPFNKGCNSGKQVIRKILKVTEQLIYGKTF